MTKRTKSAERGDDRESLMAAGERFIVLLRHGVAEERSDARPDEERALTTEGHQRMKLAAKGLSLVLPRVRWIVTSPLVRAVETSLWVKRAYHPDVLLDTSDTLRPGGDPEVLRREILAGEARRVVLVGHEPDLTEAMLAWTGLESEGMHLKKGGCYGLRVGTDGSMTLDWILPPRLLRRLGK